MARRRHHVCRIGTCAVWNHCTQGYSHEQAQAPALAADLGLGAFASSSRSRTSEKEIMHWFHSRTFLYRLGGTLWVLVLLPAILVACGSQRTEESAASVPAATSGSELFEGLGCIQCHQMEGGGVGPSLVGLYGETIPLETGETVTVDDQFIRT